jgi:hypothetical protein
MLGTTYIASMPACNCLIFIIILMLFSLAVTLGLGFFTLATLLLTTSPIDAIIAVAVRAIVEFAVGRRRRHVGMD